MIKVGIGGICGKMGQRILSLAAEDDKFAVSLGLEYSKHPCMGELAKGVKIVSEGGGIKNCDCLIEFSTPAATLEHLLYVVKFKKCAVVGTTGFSEEEINRIKQAARDVAIVLSPNMSIGVNLLFRLVKETANILKGYDVYIEEAHHIHKKDAPSGTAKKIAEILNGEGFRMKTEDIVSIRKDEIVGDHSVAFRSITDEIEISHSAKTRDIFAQGALLAAKWVINKEAGLYSMDDVLFGPRSRG